MFLSNSGKAQFHLKIKSNNTIDSIAYLKGVVFDDKNFIPKDTILLFKGVNTIKNIKPIVGGIYFLHFPKSKQKLYLTIENKDSLVMSISDSNYLQTAQINNNINNHYLNYQKLASRLSYVDSNYNLQLKNGKKFNLSQKAIFFKEKNDQLTAARNEIMKLTKPSSALYNYFDVLNKLDSSIPNKKNYSARNQLFQSIDLNSPKILFTPGLKPFLTEYLSYYPLTADSIIKGVDAIMQKVDCKGKAYPYIFDFTIKLLKNREIQNNTNAYVYFINKYVKESKCKVLDAKIEKQLLAELEQVNQLKLQDSSLNMVLKDTAGVEQNLYDFAKRFDYTIITFFDPSCEHCKVELPKMDSAIKILENQLVVRIGKFTVCNDVTLQANVWKNFINEHHLDLNYMHVHLGNNNEVRKAYDAFTNPIFYLINKEGKLIGKKISTNTLRKILISYIQTGK